MALPYRHFLQVRAAAKRIAFAGALLVAIAQLCLPLAQSIHEYYEAPADHSLAIASTGGERKGDAPDSSHHDESKCNICRQISQGRLGSTAFIPPQLVVDQVTLAERPNRLPCPISDFNHSPAAARAPPAA